MTDSRYSGRYSRTSRSRSRSPFNKSFDELPEDRFQKGGLRRRDDSRHRPARNRVFVNNIPFECRWMELKDLFREKVGEVSYVELIEDASGKFTGTGLVEFKDFEGAQKAIDIMHKFDFRGRLLNVKKDLEPERGRDYNRPSLRGMDRDRREDRYERRDDYPSRQSYDTFGLNPEFLRSLNIQGPLTPKIFISNLDYKVTEKKLEEIFKLAGKLNKMDLSLDSDGKSKGFAVGEFDHPLEAVQAISMFNGQRLYARSMNVRMDKFADDEPASKLPNGLHGIGKGLGIGGMPMQFNKADGASNGSGGFGLGIGGGLSGNSGMNVGGSMSLSSGMGLSGSMSGDRLMNSPSLGMNLSSSNLGASPISMGMSSSTSLMSSGGMGHSIERDPYLQSSPSGRSYRDNFERDSYGSSNMSDTILLGNLPSNFSLQMLKDRISEVGHVRYADIKGQGTAIIRFGNSQDAQRAIDLMNNIRFDGRAIQARMF